MFDWLFKSKQPDTKPVTPEKRAASFFSTHVGDGGEFPYTLADKMREIAKAMPTPEGAMDDTDGNFAAKMYAQNSSNVSDALSMWYVNQGFIGHHLCALVSQHWLVNKACTMPGRDALRKGFDIVTMDGDELDDKTLKRLQAYDRRYSLNYNLEQFIRMGRIFGIRIAFFKVESTDPEYYEKPFNIDGVTPGSYKGIVQVDPYLCAPQMLSSNASNPRSMHFYEPDYWLIGGKKFHRSHLIIYRPNEVPDILKPSYMYGGIPLPQMIMERVYASERTANEAPQLAMTKRTNVWLTDMGQFTAAGDKAIEKINEWASYRDNYAVKLGDKEGDQFQQTDTSLADLDTVIMTQYQLVASIAEVPATKLLGTSPKGFNASGDYEESSYHETLESIQSHDMTPMIERHHALVFKSVIEPDGGEFVETTVTWRPVNSPSAKELAETNLVRAQTGSALVQSGAIDGDDERKRISTDPTSGYHSLGLGDDGDIESMIDDIMQTIGPDGNNRI